MEDKYTIRRLAEGLLYIECDGEHQREKLERILRRTFPDHDAKARADCHFYGVGQSGGWCGINSLPRAVELIGVDEFYDLIFKEAPKPAAKVTRVCTGFILEKLYPGCRRKIGDFEPYTTGEFLKWTEFWKPMYKDLTIRHTVTHDGGKKFEVTLGEDCFMYENYHVSIVMLNEIVARSNYGRLNSWETTYPAVDFGCKKGIPISEIRKLVELFNKHN